MTHDRIEQAARECARDWYYDGSRYAATQVAEADYDVLSERIAALIRREREDAARVERDRTHDTAALASALSAWDDRAFNSMLALPHGAIVVQELRAIRARGGA